MQDTEEEETLNQLQKRIETFKGEVSEMLAELGMEDAADSTLLDSTAADLEMLQMEEQLHERRNQLKASRTFPPAIALCAQECWAFWLQKIKTERLTELQQLKDADEALCSRLLTAKFNVTNPVPSEAQLQGTIVRMSSDGRLCVSASLLL